MRSAFAADMDVRRWAVPTPKWMRDAGLTFSFTTAGLEDAKDFGKRVREAIASRRIALTTFGEVARAR